MKIKPPSTRTFDVHTPWDLLRKLSFDVNRLGAARSSNEMRYAAIDCAVGAWHVTDWVLQHVDDDTHKALSGTNRHDAKAASEFAAKNCHRLPRLQTCQRLANAGKHRVTRRPIPDEDMNGVTITSLRFDPPFRAGEPYDGDITPTAYVVFNNEKVSAEDFFFGALCDWLIFVSEEDVYFDEDDTGDESRVFHG